MLNQIVLVGKINNLRQEGNKNFIQLEVERPFKENGIKESDLFVCKAWSCIFNKIINLCNLGDIIAIKGRMIKEENQFVVMAENISIINKSKNTV